eukprot:7064672-Alexandrium_andersonii.AAC.1
MKGCGCSVNTLPTLGGTASIGGGLNESGVQRETHGTQAPLVTDLGPTFVVTTARDGRQMIQARARSPLTCRQGDVSVELGLPRDEARQGGGR